ncbi:peptide chain release factor N(5)-glutamine methyltransferase [Colwellia sp. MEBiC06753]
MFIGDEHLTIEQLISSASKQLAEHSDSPQLDARVLLAHALNKELTYLLTWFDKRLDADVVASFETLLQRRITGEPVAYIIGIKEFWSLPFLVSPSTLIPRPDTETLVELVLDNHLDQPIKLLDLGTGTGAIALALASEQPMWQIDAVDFNSDAVNLAKRNAKALKLEQVNIYQSNWFSGIDNSKRFDVIVSNPPYIDQDDPHLVQGDVRFEPESALVADNHGLADIEHICQMAKHYLTANGELYFEHGFEQGSLVQGILANHGYQVIETVKDLAGNDRITWAKL